MQVEQVDAPSRSAGASAPWLPLATAGLTLVALVLRVRAVPDDGLLFDDAWVSFGATDGSLGELLSVSTLHPGFSALLMGWARLVPDTPGWMVLPALLAGACLPAAVVWAARRLDVRPTVAVLVASLAVVAPTHVIYSGRIKPYTLETLAILVLAVSLGRLSRHRWVAADATLWVVVAVAVGSINAFALVATGLAALVLVLHPCGDRSLRIVAAAAQAMVQGALLLLLRRSFDYEALEAGWGDTFDGYVSLSANPFTTVAEVARHLSRVGQVVVVDRQWLALGIVLVAGAGLCAEALRGRHAVVARYLLLLPAVAFAGSVVERLPFGTIDQTSLFPGTRASLWLLPSVLVGLALAGERAAHHARALGGRAPVALGVSIGVLWTIVVAAALRHDVTYPAPGSDTVMAVIADRGERDLVLVMDTALWSVAAVDGAPFDLSPDASVMVGFEPEPDDRVMIVSSLDVLADSPAARRLREGAAPGTPWGCVYIVEGAVGDFDLYLDERHAALTAAGYEPVEVVEAGTSSTEVWAHTTSPTCQG